MPDDMRLVDEFMNVYHGGARIGVGGQGMVLRTRDSDIALKILCDRTTGAPLSDPAALAAAQARLQRLRVLPLPPGLALAGPVAALRDQAGYVMRLLDGMKLWPAPPSRFGWALSSPRIRAPPRNWLTMRPPVRAGCGCCN
jgi:hypothetical protein